METSAMEFNIAHGMDWNKWIREGVPYLNKSDQKKYHKYLNPTNQLSSGEKIVLGTKDKETVNV